jgi:excisionase family DNA binding protein
MIKVTAVADLRPKFVSVRDFAKLSGIGRTNIYAHLAKGNLRAVKVGGQTLIDADAGLAWIASQPAAEFGARAGRKPCGARSVA